MRVNQLLLCKNIILFAIDNNVELDGRPASLLIWICRAETVGHGGDGTADECFSPVKRLNRDSWLAPHFSVRSERERLLT